MPASSLAVKAGPRVKLLRIFNQMLAALGPQDWWPARTRLEMILGAILVQNTAWQNAALALKQMRKSGLLNLDPLRRASLGELESAVRSAGFYRQKARTIRNFLLWLDKSHNGSLARLFNQDPLETRRELLKIKGLGPETVDAILLYAGHFPFFVADAYTRRILARHGWVSPRAGYGEVQKFLHHHLPADADLFNEYHALLVEVGKQFCRRHAPHCGDCPLEVFLEPDQPVPLPHR